MCRLVRVSMIDGGNVVTAERLKSYSYYAVKHMPILASRINEGNVAMAERLKRYL